MKRKGLLAALSLCSLALASWGCRDSSTGYMPLSQGAKWSYQVEQAGTLYALYQVTGPAFVGREQGWRLVSDLGESRMGWWNGMLRASMLSGSVFDPPLPLLIPSQAAPPAKEEKGAPRIKPVEKPKVEPIRWKGRVLSAGRWQEATAELVQQRVDQKDPDLAFARTGGEGIRVFLTLKVGEKEMETITVYREGIGIVRQLIKKEGSPPANLIYSSGGAEATDTP